MNKFVKTKDGHFASIMHWIDTPPKGWYVEIYESETNDDYALDSILG